MLTLSGEGGKKKNLTGSIFSNIFRVKVLFGLFLFLEACSEKKKKEKQYPVWPWDLPFIKELKIIDGFNGSRAHRGKNLLAKLFTAVS